MHVRDPDYGSGWSVCVISRPEMKCRDGLEQLYSAGARRFAVWDLCAGEAVPLAHTLNNLMNTVNAILQGIRALDARQNALRDFTKTFVVSSLEQSPSRCNDNMTVI